jgi:hypothetical protein
LSGCAALAGTPHCPSISCNIAGLSNASVIRVRHLRKRFTQLLGHIRLKVLHINVSLRAYSLIPLSCMTLHSFPIETDSLIAQLMVD